MNKTPALVTRKDLFVRNPRFILYAFCRFRIPGEVRQIVDAVMCMTYGYHKIEAKITNSEFVEITGLIKQNANRALGEAIEHKIVIESDDKLSLNENTLEWVSFKSSSKVITKKSSSKVITKVIKSDYGLSSKLITPIYIKKKRNKKDARVPQKKQEAIDTTASNGEQEQASADGKQALVPLTRQERYEIASACKVNIADVKQTEEQVLNPENIHKYKHETTYWTTKKWLQTSISKGNQRQLDEIGMMVLKTQAQEYLRKENTAYGTQ